ncbi:MAG: hypothetical protein L0956_08385, partial [Candidatus Mariimomonas ferrooxydans]
ITNYFFLLEKAASSHRDRAEVMEQNLLPPFTGKRQSSPQKYYCKIMDNTLSSIKRRFIQIIYIFI